MGVRTLGKLAEFIETDDKENIVSLTWVHLCGIYIYAHEQLK